MALGGSMNWQVVAKRIRIPLGVVVPFLYAWLASPTQSSLLLSFPAVSAGLGLRGYAAGTLRKKQELATSGPYAYTRNPLYLGSMLIAAGFAVASKQWTVGIMLALLFAVIYGPTIRGEEGYLRRKFPGYEAYAEAVPRIVPRLIPARFGNTTGGFSWAQYAKNREYQAILGVSAVYAFLIAKLVFGF